MTKKVISFKASEVFTALIEQAVAPLGFKNKAALAETAVREFLQKKGFDLTATEQNNNDVKSTAT